MASIWVDGDACPNPIKAILFKAAERHRVKLTLVANHALSVPPSRYIATVRVSSGFDVADHYLVAQLEANDLLISADIPLAAEAIAKGGCVVTPRGEALTAANIGERLNMRDFLILCAAQVFKVVAPLHYPIKINMLLRDNLISG